MKQYNMNDIREKFLTFFQEREHNRLKSFSLIPQGDKSLLLINAGMAPLKDYFMGIKKMEPSRATTSQKCVRTQDLDNVGKTARHGTFFEMLGNFSFGNYFKKEAIHWAYEFLVDEMGLEPEKLYVSVYLDDDFAYDVWTKEVGIPEEKMLRLGKEDNFWELEQGPCGPCSEIHYDRGEAYGPGKSPLDNSDRFMEVWNLVFTQFNKTAEGEYIPLDHPNIDTGMGLERIACIMEGADNIFDLSTFRPIRNEIERLSGKRYGDSDETDVSIRVIVDHVKTMSFLVADGVIPSNEGRGYVLRRIIRRAARHGKLLGIKGNFLTDFVPLVVEAYQPEYSELVEGQERIMHIISKEEENFQKTIDSGLSLLDGVIADLKKEGKNVIDGAQAFKLYDTYGFPLDLTKEIAEEQGIEVDEIGFKANMEEQRTQSREHRQNGTGWSEGKAIDTDNLPETVFTGYEQEEGQGKVLALFADSESVDSLEKGESGVVVLDETPFYGESGGQVGDIGYFESDSMTTKVDNTKKTGSGVFLHYVEVVEGAIHVGDTIRTYVNSIRREDIRRNHSATHLLHKALKMVLGDHIQQAGSMVDEEHLRFDFTHFEALTAEQITEVEGIVNRAIFDSYPVKTEIMSLSQATEDGAVGLFEDKYQDQVRVLSMGDFSKELCGGTHVKNTAQIQMMRITAEQGISSGVRRIEAITGRASYDQVLEYERQLNLLAERLKTNRTNLDQRLQALLDEDKELKRELASLQSKQAGELSNELTGEMENIEGVNLIAKNIPSKSVNELKELVDNLKEGRDNLVVVLASANDGKVGLVASVDDLLTKQGINAGQIVKEVAQATGGNGGGRPNFATAGGKDADKIEEALKLVAPWIRDHIKK